jgi:hypothetical protein
MKKEPKSRKERMKKFDPRKWAGKWMNTPGSDLHFIKATGGVSREEYEETYGVGANAMASRTATNKSRKDAGWDLDPAQEPLPCDGCSKPAMLYIVNRIEKRAIYWCEACINKSKQEVVDKTFKNV